MRYVMIEHAEPEMILATDVYDSNGRTLLSKGGILSSTYIGKLMNLGLEGVYIDDDISEGIEIPPTISPALRSEGLSAVRNQDIDGCQKVASRIVEEIIENGAFYMDMADLRTYSDYTFAHSVNVAVLSCTIALGLNYSQEQLSDVCCAGLLHDLGKLEIPNEILEKPGRLTQEEFAMIKTHSQFSYDLIKSRLDISSMVKNAVFCHHENYDGSGYPNGYTADKTSTITKILHVADVYDALVSKRPYKKPYAPSKAVEILLEGKGTMFDPEVVDAFLHCVPLYPKGSTVMLDTGHQAIVVDNTGERNRRPLLRLFDKIEIDLSDPKYEQLSIVNTLDESALHIQEEAARIKMIAPLDRHKIIVVDKSEETYLDLSRKMSFLYEFQLAHADSQVELIIKKEGIPSAVIIDMDTQRDPNHSGLQELNEKIASMIPIILLGTDSNINTIVQYKKMGITNYILKPYQITYLQQEIQKCMND